jgi:hypothetical protein
MPNRRAAERPTAGTTRTATTVWIGPTAARGELLVDFEAFLHCRVVAPRANAVHVAAWSARGACPRAAFRKGQPGGSPCRRTRASLAMAISVALIAADHPPEHVRVDADCELDQLPCGDPRVGQMSLTTAGLPLLARPVHCVNVRYGTSPTSSTSWSRWSSMRAARSSTSGQTPSSRSTWLRPCCASLSRPSRTADLLRSSRTRISRLIGRGS